MSRCSADGCGLEATAKGLCYKHYMRMRRTGKLTTIRLMGDFWSKVKRGAPNECWPWLGFVKPSGHGLTSIRGRMMHTSRKAWILTHGPIPEGLSVNHRCDNAICCNPAHMYLGTRSDNAIDQWAQLPPEERGHKVRPCMLTQVQLEKLWQMRREGALLRECAAAFGVHIATVCRYITIVRKQKLEKLRAVRLSTPNAKEFAKT